MSGRVKSLVNFKTLSKVSAVPLTVYYRDAALQEHKLCICAVPPEAWQTSETFPASAFVDQSPEIDFALAQSVTNFTYRGVHDFNSCCQIKAVGSVYATVGSWSDTHQWVEGAVANTGYSWVDYKEPYGSLEWGHRNNSVTIEPHDIPGQEGLILRFVSENHDKYRFQEERVSWGETWYFVPSRHGFTRIKGSTGVSMDCPQITTNTGKRLSGFYNQILTVSSDNSPGECETIARTEFYKAMHALSFEGKMKTVSQFTNVIAFSSTSAPSYLAQKVQALLINYEDLYRKFSMAGRPWSAMSADAMEDIGLAQNNGLAYAKDAAELAKSAIMLRDTLTNTRDALLRRKVGQSKINKAVSVAANAYLSTHYGTRLMLQDTLDYRKTLRDIGKNLGFVTRASSMNKGTFKGWTFTQRYHVLYDSFAKEEDLLYDFCRQLDLIPRAGLIWDSMPYSFVIDWFTKFGDQLNAIDNYFYLQTTYKLIGSIASIRAVRPVTAADLGLDTRIFHVNVNQVFYGRACKTSVSAPISLGSPAPKFNHYLEAGALVVQRIT